MRVPPSPPLIAGDATAAISSAAPGPVITGYFGEARVSDRTIIATGRATVKPSPSLTRLGVYLGHIGSPLATEVGKIQVRPEDEPSYFVPYGSH